VECVAPLSLCGSSTDGGVCALTSSDRANCGQCGRACGAAEECLNGACTPRLLAGCEEVPNVTDAGSTVLLFQNRSPVRPFRAWCQTSGAQPRTYLLVDAGGNFSEYDNFRWGLGCQTVAAPNGLTTFSGLRLDPATGVVQVDDFTLSVSRDGGRAGNSPGQMGDVKVPWASASDCSCSAPQGDGRFDLTRTPFGVDQASTTFNLEGFNPRGGATLSERGQFGVLLGGGFCGGLTPRLSDGRAAVRLRYINTWSCESILRARPGSPSGVYNLFDGTGPNATGTPLAWCDMTTAGGGWTLLLKVDGRRPDSAFGYESPLWSNDTLFGPPVPDVTDTEAKYAAFSTLPFTELRLSNTANNASLTITAPPNAASLRDLVAGSAPVTLPMPLGASRWLQFFGSSGDAGVLQPNCNREAFGNVSAVSRVRLGIVTNNENDCASPDSYVGVGSSLSAPNCFGLPDGGFQGPFTASACGPQVAAPAFVQVWVR
jgi:hypothetical protein